MPQAWKAPTATRITRRASAVQRNLEIQCLHISNG
jgi:hypothetical protein